MNKHWRWFLLPLLVLAVWELHAFYYSNEIYKESEPEFTSLQEGDIIFVRGREWQSRFVAALDHSVFTHVGVIVYDNKKNLSVLHAAPHDLTTSLEGISRVETIQSFTSSKKVSSFSVFRIKNFESSQIDYHRFVGLPFDSEFRLDTPDRLYCTELVVRLASDLGYSLNTLERDYSLFLQNYKILSPESLLKENSNLLSHIYSYKL